MTISLDAATRARTLALATPRTGRLLERRDRDADWTGAEIKSCCRLAALLDVPLVEAAQNVVPVARTAHEAVERLRTWTSGRCLSADYAGLYTRNPNTGTVKPGRKVRRADPSNN